MGQDLRPTVVSCAPSVVSTEGDEMSGLKCLLDESGMLPQGESLDPRGQPEVGPGTGGETTQLTRDWRTRGEGGCDVRTWDHCSHVKSLSQ